MFDNEKIWRIIGECCVQVRKGDPIEERDVGILKVFEINTNPSIEELTVNDATDVIVDLHFINIMVDKTMAEKRREEFIEQLDQWPNTTELAGGPSYITLGGVIGDQGTALCFIALGAVLGLWSVITPKTFGVTGPQADQLAGAGYVMCSGYSKDRVG